MDRDCRPMTIKEVIDKHMPELAKLLKNGK